MRTKLSMTKRKETILLTRVPLYLHGRYLILTTL